MIFTAFSPVSSQTEKFREVLHKTLQRYILRVNSDRKIQRIQAQMNKACDTVFAFWLVHTKEKVLSSLKYKMTRNLPFWKSLSFPQNDNEKNNNFSEMQDATKFAVLKKLFFLQSDKQKVLSSLKYKMPWNLPFWKSLFLLQNDKEKEVNSLKNKMPRSLPLRKSMSFPQKDNGKKLQLLWNARCHEICRSERAFSCLESDRQKVTNFLKCKMPPNLLS